MAEHTERVDGNLQSGTPAPGAVNLARLRFQRWLIEHGRLEHPPAGPPAGELVGAVAGGELAAAASVRVREANS